MHNHHCQITADIWQSITAGKAARATAAKIRGNGRVARACTMAPSTRNSSKAPSTAPANPTAVAPAGFATSSLPAASMPITMGLGAALRSPCRLSMRASRMVIIGVGVRATITRIVRLALCILISRRGRRGRMGSRLLGRMDRRGMVSKAVVLKWGFKGC